MTYTALLIRQLIMSKIAVNIVVINTNVVHQTLNN